ncbi:MAG: BlaI/MecI/CopY family transcriptional regulator [Actinomycetota bacterium]|nr:BlaI/MecI/CopY family transcriptional regulator [Actinomycetota bacterium]
MGRRPDGTLERDVLRILWACDDALLPGEINDRLDSDLAYTSIATVLTRLLDKGHVTREPRGRAFAYRAMSTEAAFTARRVNDLIAASSDRVGVLSAFIGTLNPDESRAIRELLDEALSDTVDHTERDR